MSRPTLLLLRSCAVALALAPWSYASAASPYKLPWPPGIPMELTQDCNDSYYADHIGSGSYAWDFANGTHFSVSAARSGTVTHLKMSSHTGCNTSGCVDTANYIIVDHGDGTASVYLHLDGDTLDPQVRCGQPVAQGQRLANAGSTGWSTGPHLHFQVNPVHPTPAVVCECGADGKGCAEDYAAWSSFWSSPGYPSQPVVFEEWPATACADRRMVLPVSQNTGAPLGPSGMPLDLAYAVLGDAFQGPPPPSALLSPAATPSPSPSPSPSSSPAASASSGSAATASGAPATPPSSSSAATNALASSDGAPHDQAAGSAGSPTSEATSTSAAPTAESRTTGTASRSSRAIPPTGVGGKRSAASAGNSRLSGTARSRKPGTPRPSPKAPSSALPRR